MGSVKFPPWATALMADGAIDKASLSIAMSKASAANKSLFSTLCTTLPHLEKKLINVVSECMGLPQLDIRLARVNSLHENLFKLSSVEWPIYLPLAKSSNVLHVAIGDATEHNQDLVSKLKIATGSVFVEFIQCSPYELRETILKSRFVNGENLPVSARDLLGASALTEDQARTVAVMAEGEGIGFVEALYRTSFLPEDRLSIYLAQIHGYRCAVEKDIDPRTVQGDVLAIASSAYPYPTPLSVAGNVLYVGLAEPVPEVEQRVRLRARRPVKFLIGEPGFLLGVQEIVLATEFSRPPPQDSARVFISYRRDDSAGFTGRIHDRLVDHFGADRIFLDIDNILPGEDFVQIVDGVLRECDVVLVIVGPHWLDSDDHGRRRIDIEDDFHRLEIERALDSRKKVLPVLVGGASMPVSEQLPISLKALSRRNAFEVSDKRFKQDVSRLVDALNGLLGSSGEERSAMKRGNTQNS